MLVKKIKQNSVHAAGKENGSQVSTAENNSHHHVLSGQEERGTKGGCVVAVKCIHIPHLVYETPAGGALNVLRQPFAPEPSSLKRPAEVKRSLIERKAGGAHACAREYTYRPVHANRTPVSMRSSGPAQPDNSADTFVHTYGCFFTAAAFSMLWRMSPLVCKGAIVAPPLTRNRPALPSFDTGGGARGVSEQESD